MNNDALKSATVSGQPEMGTSRPFGFLFTLDLYECREGACDDISLCYDFLERLVEELKMQKQAIFQEV